MSVNINAFASAVVIGTRKGLGRPEAIKLGVLSSLVAGDNTTNAVLFPLILAEKFRPPPTRVEIGKETGGSIVESSLGKVAAAIRGAGRETLATDELKAAKAVAGTGKPAAAEKSSKTTKS